MNNTTKAEREKLLAEAMKLVKAGLEPRAVAHELREKHGISRDRARRYAYKAVRRLRHEEMVQK